MPMPVFSSYSPVPVPHSLLSDTIFQHLKYIPSFKSQSPNSQTLRLIFPIISVFLKYLPNFQSQSLRYTFLIFPSLLPHKLIFLRLIFHSSHSPNSNSHMVLDPALFCLVLSHFTVLGPRHCASSFQIFQHPHPTSHTLRYTLPNVSA